jgi:hypothetical protein
MLLGAPVSKPALLAALFADFKDIARTSRAIAIEEPDFSSAAIETLLGEAQDLITRLDTVMHNKYSRNPDKLLAWKSAARVERPGRKTEPTTPPPAPTGRSMTA